MRPQDPEGQCRGPPVQDSVLFPPGFPADFQGFAEPVAFSGRATACRTDIFGPAAFAGKKHGVIELLPAVEFAELFHGRFARPMTMASDSSFRSPERRGK